MKESKNFEESKNLEILITGSRGFIGEYLKKRLKSLDIYFKEVPINLDLSNQKDVEDLPSSDIVIHLASRLPQKSINGDYEKEFIMMQNILNYCEKNNAKLIFTSSCAVYGNLNPNPIKENFKLSPINSYGKIKKECEQLCRNSNVNGFILRLFNVYGPNQYKKFIIPSLIQGADSGKVKLTPNIKRDFIYISDVIDILLKSIYYKSNDLKILNIGFGKSYSLETVFKKIEKITNKKIDIMYSSSKQSVSDIYADIDKSRKLFDWKPKISLEEGLKRTISLKKR